MIYIDVSARCKESCRTACAGVCWDVDLHAVARCKVHGGKVARWQGGKMVRWLGAKTLANPFNQVGHRQCQAVTLVLRLHNKDYDIKAGKKVLKKN